MTRFFLILLPMLLVGALGCEYQAPDDWLAVAERNIGQVEPPPQPQWQAFSHLHPAQREQMFDWRVRPAPYSQMSVLAQSYQTQHDSSGLEIQVQQAYWWQDLFGFDDRIGLCVRITNPTGQSLEIPQAIAVTDSTGRHTEIYNNLAVMTRQQVEILLADEPRLEGGENLSWNIIWHARFEQLMDLFTVEVTCADGQVLRYRMQPPKDPPRP